MAAITALSLLGYDVAILAHLYLGSFPQLFSADPLKLCQFGWGASLHGYFQGFRVQVRALAGPLKDIQRLIPDLLLRCLGCVLRVVVLLEGDPSPQSEGLSTLEQVFIKELPFPQRNSGALSE